MKLNHVLCIAGCVACGAGGFVLAQRLANAEAQRVANVTEEQTWRETATLRTDAMQWADHIARSGGESLLRAFVGAVSPAVVTQRRESIELAATGLLRISGVAGIHVLAGDGEILYSSDAKLTTTGDTEYRGAWALKAVEFATRDSARSGVVEYAMPIAHNDQKLAVAWLEYDVAQARDAARPASFGGAPAPDQSETADPSGPE